MEELIALLARFYKIERVSWELSPFENTGATWESPRFIVRAFDWNEELDEPFPNFEWLNHDFRVTWYKYASGSSIEFNRQLSTSEMVQLLKEWREDLRDHHV